MWIALLMRPLAFVPGLALVIGPLFSVLSTFVLPRSTRSQLNRLLFGVLRRAFEGLMRFARAFEQKDAIFAYYAPIGLILLAPTWYLLIDPKSLYDPHGKNRSKVCQFSPLQPTSA